MANGKSDQQDYHAQLSALFQTFKGQWVPRLSSSPHAVGDTFEDLIKKPKDNAAAPDFGDIEIKVIKGNSIVTLMSKSPATPVALREKYGSLEEGKTHKSLSATFGAKGFTNSSKHDYDFKLVVDRAEKRLKVLVRDKAQKIVSDGDLYWDFNDLENSVVKKLARVALIQHENDAQAGLIRYTDLELVEGFTFKRFLQAAEEGALYIDIRLRENANGKPHDHGIAFRMHPKDLRKYGAGQAAVLARETYTPHLGQSVAGSRWKKMLAKVWYRLNKPRGSDSKPKEKRVPPRYNKRGQQICYYCKRPITDPESKRLGYGPTCGPNKRT